MNVIHRRTLVSDAILSQAERMLDSGEVEGLTLQRLASSLGYATTAIYRYFTSKEALIVALQRRALESLAREIDRALEAHDGTPLTALAAAALACAEWPARAPGHFRLIALSLGESKVMIDDSLAAPVATDTAALLARVDIAAHKAATAGQLAAEPEHFASTLWATLHGLLVMRKLARLPALAHLAQDATLHRAITTVLIGYGAAPEAARDALRRAHEGTRT